MSSKVVIFKLNHEEFAVSINQVERILGFIEPTKVPEAPFFIKGVIKYQDSILPIMDLKLKFNKNSKENYDNPKIIVVKNNDRSIGLLVDDVQEVIDIEDKDVENTPDIISQYSNKYISGIIKKDKRIIMYLNTDKVLSKEELKELQTI